jgi:DNA-binding transcriptional MerR regulator
MADTASLATRSGGKSAEAFRTISEVAAALDVPQHVLRFWESKFSQVRPLKRGGGRRYYRPEDVELLQTIRGLLYDDGYTIKGVQKLLRDGSLKSKRRPARAADTGTAKAKPVRSADAPASGDKLSPARRKTLQGLLDELEQLKAMLERALD